MTGRVSIEGAGIAAVAYALVLAAHVELPGTLPFALFLLAGTPLVALLASPSERPPRACRVASPARRRRLEDEPAVTSSPAGRATRASGRGPREGRDEESRGLAAMRAALRRLEGELHALEDQRLTELARTKFDRDIRRGFR